MNLYCDQLLCPDSFPWRFADIIASDDCIISVLFSDTEKQRKTNEITDICKKQLYLYFNKELIEFNLPIAKPKSVFSGLVYEKLVEIPYGKITHYKDIAVAMGDAKKSRAVGRACATNKLSIIIPCHRVVSSTGNLTGYAGGLQAKEWLIAHERRELHK